MCCFVRQSPAHEPLRGACVGLRPTHELRRGVCVASQVMILAKPKACFAKRVVSRAKRIPAHVLLRKSRASKRRMCCFASHDFGFAESMLREANHEPRRGVCVGQGPTHGGEAIIARTIRYSLTVSHWQSQLKSKMSPSKHSPCGFNSNFSICSSYLLRVSNFGRKINDPSFSRTS
jgi:hypothetical protein